MSGSVALVVIASLKEVDSTVADEIDDTVFLCKAPRPGAAWEVFQWFRLADSFEGVANDNLHQVERPKRDLSVCLDPEFQVFHELRLKYRDPLTRSLRMFVLTSLCQGLALFEAPLWTTEAGHDFELWREPREVVRRFWASEADALFRVSSQVLQQKPAPRHQRHDAE